MRHNIYYVYVIDQRQIAIGFAPESTKHNIVVDA